MHTFAVLTALATAASAYMVVQPNTANGWTDAGPQPVSWDRVSTDPVNFTIVLTNMNREFWPQDQVLVAEQDGVNVKNISVNPPSGGWTTGPGFRVNFVRNVDNQNTIYAQSNEFTISVATTTARTTARPTGTTIQANPLTTTNPANTLTPSGNTSPPGTNGATAITVTSSLLVLLAAVSYVVA